MGKVCSHETLYALSTDLSLDKLAVNSQFQLLL